MLEPETDYVSSWHVDAICEHLEAVTHGQITRLLMNVPPGSMKSLLTSVMWPAWEWGPAGRPWTRYVATSHSEAPVKRDSRKMRDLVQSPWFQARWPINLVRAGELSFANDATGSREGVPFGSLTGQRGNRLVLDDPHSTELAESDTERGNTTRKFREGATNRLNDQTRDAIIVMMQRLHEHDISGVILALAAEDYVHLMLPMEFEPERKCYTRIGFQDPRVEDGELLCPARFSREKVESDFKKVMGSYAYAGQYQQRPAPREGGMFKRAWFKPIKAHEVPAGTRWVRHWDLASTKRKASDMRRARTAGVKMGKTRDGRFIIQSCIARAIDGEAVRRLIRMTADTDTHQCRISLPQDPGQAGVVQKQSYLSLLERFQVRIKPETGSKEDRAEPFAAQCEGGNVYIVEADWNEEFLSEVALFPGGARKDIVDACSGAYAELVRTSQWLHVGGVVGGVIGFSGSKTAEGYENE